MKCSKVKPWFGFFGLLGFFGFAGFLKPEFFTFFMFFVFLGLYWDGKMSNDMKDERYEQNLNRSKSILFDISCVFSLVLIIALSYTLNINTLKITLILYFVSMLIGKSYLTYYYDKKGA